MYNKYFKHFFRYLLENQPIDLINVAFAKNSSFKGSDILYGHPAFDTPDRITGRRGVAALCKVCPRRNWNFIEVRKNILIYFSPS